MAADRDVDMATVPLARAAIRACTLRTLTGKNYWSRRPVTRLDLSIGVFDEISSADVPGLTVRLVTALPGLREHECSLGRPGGFVERLHEGTYAPHIIEHVALELQRLVGYDVGYGRTRGAEAARRYVVAFEHEHAAVGRAAAERATAIVRGAFDGTPLRVPTTLRAMRAAALEAGEPAPTETVLCAVCDPRAPTLVAAAWRRAGIDVVAFAPAAIVERGLPYHLAQIGVVTVASSHHAPPGFRSDDRPTRLFSVVVDGLARGAPLVCPSDATELQADARDRGHPVVTFEPGDDMPALVRDVAARWAR